MSTVSAVDGSWHRAEVVKARLEELWGDELPPGPHPELTVLADAVTSDDEAGTSRGLVVTGDGVTLEDLRLALAAGSWEDALAHLPPSLVSRLREAQGSWGSLRRARA